MMTTKKYLTGSNGLMCFGSRETIFTTISLPRPNAQNTRITFAERPNLNAPPVVASLSPLGTASDFLALGDRIHHIDGISTKGMANDEVLNMLCNGHCPAKVQIEYLLPEFLSQNSLFVTTQTAQISVQRENGSLGLTLRGGGEIPLIVTSIRPYGPVFKTGRIKCGDRLLKIDNISLLHKTLVEAQIILKNCQLSDFACLTVEYDVSLMKTSEISSGGPLLVEIEKPLNEKLGLGFSRHPINAKSGQYGVFIAQILPASVADRCGALTIGDQILSVDGTDLSKMIYSPEEVASLIDTKCAKGFIQIKILPTHALETFKGFDSLYATSRKNYNSNGNGGYAQQQQQQLTQQQDYRSFSEPPTPDYRSESVTVELDCAHGSGICLGQLSLTDMLSVERLFIENIIFDSSADRTGCIQKGDRVLAINRIKNLDLHEAQKMLGDYDYDDTNSTAFYSNRNWIEMEIEFDVPIVVMPQNGIFNVELVRYTNSSLGITVHKTEEDFVITAVKKGSPAYRTGYVRVGDILQAINGQPIQNYNVDTLLFDYGASEATVLTIKRMPHTTSTLMLNKSRQSPFMQRCFEQDKQKRITAAAAAAAATGGRGPSVHSENSIGHNMANYLSLDKKTINSTSIGNLSSDNGGVNGVCNGGHNIGTTKHKTFNVVLQPNQNGPLGITLVGSPDINRPIVVSSLSEGGVAFNSGQIYVGDYLLAVNGVSVKGMTLTQVISHLQNLNDFVELRILRILNDFQNGEHLGDNNLLMATTMNGTTRGRSNSKSKMDGRSLSVESMTALNVNTNVTINSASASSSSTIPATCGGGTTKLINVTLHKDKVYEDYGFSVSDGLYDRGVYINRIRSGGPADIVGQLKSYDRIIQVNETKTKDFDCCLTVPLIAAAGDRINLIIERTLTD